MTIQTIDTVTPEIGLKGAGEKINANFTNAAHAASYEVGTDSGQIPRNSDLPTFGGTGATDVPTNANLSASIAGTATFSGDVYTFSPSGTGFRPLQAGMYLSFRLPSGSANTTTTPDISYNGTTYVIKWIDGSALASDDLEQTYNKQPILFYFDGTDMLIASDISGSNSNGDWTRSPCGSQSCWTPFSLNFMLPGLNTIDAFDDWTFPKSFLDERYQADCVADNGLDTDEVIAPWGSSLSSATQLRFRSSGNISTFRLHLSAKGRWY